MLKQIPTNQSSPYRVVLCTCPDMETATQLANHIVGAKLAACVNIIPHLTSIYSWNNKIEKTSEILLIIKTTLQFYKALEVYLADAHPYECPEIIALPIEQGLTGYLKWIDDTLL
jgi:periplasmic divalent cation tolerance protein